MSALANGASRFASKTAGDSWKNGSW